VEGGSCNDYDYSCADPCNKFDLDGRTHRDSQELCRSTAGVTRAVSWGGYVRGAYWIGKGDGRKGYANLLQTWSVDATGSVLKRGGKIGLRTLGTAAGFAFPGIGSVATYWDGLCSLDKWAGSRK
jgi:hypothetical protein